MRKTYRARKRNCKNYDILKIEMEAHRIFKYVLNKMTENFQKSLNRLRGAP
jgi:hypothetical protein